jgi:AraC-like DNA-binding protein
MAKQKLPIPEVLDGNLWRHAFSAPPERREHRHDEPELNLVLAGSGAYLVDGRRYDLGPGSLVWLLPQQSHLLVDESPDLAMWIGVFRRAMLRRLVTRGGPRPILAGRPEGAFCHLLAESAAEELDALIARVAGHAADPPLFNAALAFVALAAWRLHEQADQSPLGAEVHPAVERAARFLRADPAHTEFDDLARRVGLSLSRLSRLFKQQTGVPLVTFRQRQRLRRFTELYGRGRRRTLTEAALEAGFGSYPQFHRVFKQAYGISPRQYHSGRN